jgi:hypothetical protein
MGFLEILFLILCALKLVGFVSLSWAALFGYYLLAFSCVYAIYLALALYVRKGSL